jgi:hypothetical protein
MQGEKLHPHPILFAFISKDLSVSTGYETAFGTFIGLPREAAGEAARPTPQRLAATTPALTQFHKPQLRSSIPM